MYVMSRDVSHNSSAHLPPPTLVIYLFTSRCLGRAPPLSVIPLRLYSPANTSTVPPPLGRPVKVWGGIPPPNTQANWRVGGRLHGNPHYAQLFSFAPSQISLSSMGPAICTGSGVFAMKLEYLQGAPPHLHTQTSYAGTRDNMYTAEGVYACYNHHCCPMQLCGWHFSAVEERVNPFIVTFRSVLRKIILLGFWALSNLLYCSIF